MTPVTGTVTYTYNDGFLFGTGAFKRLRRPWIPVNRVVRVLEEVGRRFFGKSVHIAMLYPVKHEPGIKVENPDSRLILYSEN
jgi:hypothetical protein